MNEFDLIRTYFASQGLARDDVAVSIGDDAAVINIPAGMQQVVTTDVLVAGTHFLPGANPDSVGYKSLAINFSDLAAMGAIPTGFMLSLSLPEVNAAWLEGFRDGMFRLANEYKAQLVGGDTVRGPLAVSVQAYGLVPEGEALLRCGAKPRDRIYVTGVLGDAALALLNQRDEVWLEEKDQQAVFDRLSYPKPRLSEAVALRGVASSCIDVSDGLLADLGHILEASGVGARIVLDRLPLSAAYRRYFDQSHDWDLAIAGGDDYELCFTVPVANELTVERLKSQWACGATYIGVIEAEPGLRVLDETGKAYDPQAKGYDHFTAPSPQPLPLRGGGED